ncbi:MAG: flagellar motor switch protein FliG [Candidatus Binatia bacterium]
MADEITGVEKAAVLLLSLGPEVATEVFRHLDEGEVRQVTKALARIRNVPADHIRAVEQDYRKRVSSTRGMRVDGLLFARALVNESLAGGEGGGGNVNRDEILAELDQLPSGDATGLMHALEGVPPDGLARLLETEHPQIATLILAHLTPSQGMLVLRSLPEVVQTDLVERLARLDAAIPASLIQEVGHVLRDQVKGLARETGKSAGGPKVVAEMMKHADKTTEGRIFEELEQRDAELAGSIRAMLFTFEDCLQFDNRSMQTLLKEVAREDLLLALKTASPGLSEKIFANVSSRAAEILREDLGSSGPARLKDVETAQQRIVASVRDLEADGKLVIAGGGSDDVLV